ncbi:MAG: hypothetical protein KF768_00925 [Phycisphaeraceae bacterium]|nr:hypothetical protein [Phycisphaeraceae bacterium]
MTDNITINRMSEAAHHSCSAQRLVARSNARFRCAAAIIAVITLLFIGTSVQAQIGIGGGSVDPHAPEQDPILQPERRPGGVPGSSPAPAQPTMQPEPVRGAPVPTPSVDTGRPIGGGMLAEGSFVAGALGIPAQGKSGAWYFIFESDQRGPGGISLPAMVIMPGPNLAALERMSGRLTDSDRLRVTGQVFVYSGLNYLMLMAPPIMEISRSAEPASVPASPPAPKPEPTPAPGEPAPAGDIAAETRGPTRPTQDEPTIQQIIEQLDRRVGSSRRVELPPGGGRAETNGADGSPGLSAPLVPGGFLAARRGRLVRSADGASLFVLDSGHTGRTESPMVLMPSQNLARMESIAAAQGERVTFTVSGDVVVFRGQNHLLPRLFVVNRPTDLVISGQ